MSHPLLPQLLAYLQDPDPEARDHSAVENALEDPERRAELFEAMAEHGRKAKIEAREDARAWAAFRGEPYEKEPDDVPEAKAIVGPLAFWGNWLDGYVVKVGRIENDLADCDALKHAVTGFDETIRATGQRSSDNAVCPPAENGTVIDLRRWTWGEVPNHTAPVAIPLEKKTSAGSTQVRVFGFEKLAHLIARLRADDLALVNTGSFTGQTIAGPFSTGTHGSGKDLGAMADGVKAVDIMGADGKVRRIRSADCLFPATETVHVPGRKQYEALRAPDGVPLNAAVVSMGTFGVVLSYILEVEDAYRLRQVAEKGNWVALMAKARTAMAQPRGPQRPRHVELYLRPDQRDGDNAVLLQRFTTDDTRDRPFGGTPWYLDIFKGNTAGSFAGKLAGNNPFVRNLIYNGILNNQIEMNNTRGPWHEILVRDTGISAHGFEVFFPYEYFEQGVGAVLAGIDVAATDKAFVTGSIGVRFVKAGRHMLAMNHRRYRVGSTLMTTDAWVTVEVARLLGTRNHEKVPARILEALTASGVPHRVHWGQYFPTGQVDMPRAYPRMPRWKEARQTFGASEKFLTPTLAKLLGLPFAQPRTLAAPAVEGNGRRMLVVLGDAPTSADRREVIRAKLLRAADAVGAPRPTVRFAALDDQLVPQRPDGGEDTEDVQARVVKQALDAALGRLLRYRSGPSGRSWLHALENTQGFHPERLVHWLTDEGARSRLRERMRFLLTSFRPEVVVAHGVGGLVVYDTLTHTEASVELPDVDLLTLGTGIGHKAFRALWGGVVRHPATVQRWFHLTHPDDPAFAAPLPLSRVRNLTVRSDAAPHDPGALLDHPRLAEEVWRPLLTEKAPVAPPLHQRVQSAARRKQKALLVGIDRYAGTGMDLEGCVNDVYAISQLLQSRFDYRPGDVRLLTNERATADALEERLDWLLSDARPHDRRVLFFSGHGVRLPSYNALEVVDQLDEGLALHDFDWDRPGTAFVDDAFAAWYAQLDHDVRFTALFDCCHSGGMARAAGARVRGLPPPDDIRHRMLAYESGWTDRFDHERRDRLKRLTEDAGELRVANLGAGATVRSERAQYVDRRQVRGHDGPFMPLMAYACGEGELAFEHQVGPTVHGAFTWTLLQKAKRGTLPSFQQLVERRVRPGVRRLGYAQTAEVNGPVVRLEEPFSL